MSRECTSYDVRVVLYDTSKGMSANIVFFNDNELMLDCSRVKLVRDGSRLYFHRGDFVKDSLKLSGKESKNIIQMWTDYTKVSDMEGLYDLKFDTSLDLYYIDKDERLSDYQHRDIKKGIKQLNHNSRNREKRGDYIMTATLKEPAKRIIENKQQESKEQSTKTVEKTAATTIVVKALVNLLKVQVEGNEDALSTIDALEKYI